MPATAPADDAILPPGLVLGAGDPHPPAVAALAGQAGPLALHANAPLDADLPVLPDRFPESPGPLAGVLAGLDWAAAQGFDRLVTVPADLASCPGDLVRRLQEAAGPMRPAVAESGGRWRPGVALWPVLLTERLRAALATGLREPEAALARFGATPVAIDGLVFAGG